MRKTLIAFLIITLISLVGCSSNGETTTITDPFVGGTDGVVVDFEEDAPPEEVYDGGEFPFGVVVSLKNEGEFSVLKEDVDVVISGVYASEFGKEEAELKTNPIDNLEPTQKDSEGDIVESNPVYVEFEDLNYLGKLAGSTEFTIRADVCYKYGTSAISKICIREDNLDTDEGVCEVNEVKDVFSSGAPVQVTDFKETARSKTKVAFTFRVSHDNDGLIFRQGTKCDSARTNEDRIWVEVSTGIEGLECNGLREGDATSGYITLYGNDKPITCVQEVSTTSDYEQTVNINLLYDYEDYEETAILVKHSLSD